MSCHLAYSTRSPSESPLGIPLSGCSTSFPSGCSTNYSKSCSLKPYLEQYHNKQPLKDILFDFCITYRSYTCMCAFEFFIEDLINKGIEPAELFERRIPVSFLYKIVCSLRFKFIPYLALYGVDLNKKYDEDVYNYNVLEILIKNLFNGECDDNFIETYKTLVLYGCDDRNISQFIGSFIPTSKKSKRQYLSRRINSKLIGDFLMSLYRKELEEVGFDD